MAVLQINGDFSLEKNKSDERFAAVEAAIGTIESQIEVLTSAWQDEKSSDFITSLQGYLTDIKTKLTSAKNSANSTFDELYKCLKIYQGE